MDSSEPGGRYAEWSDDQLLRWAAQHLSVPKADPANSFVLHAPLELMARAALLPLVNDAHRDEARLRIVALTDEYLAAGPAVEPPGEPKQDDAAGALVDAIAAGDLDEIDRYAAWLGANTSPKQIRELLGPAIAPSLAAAAHASIGLELVGRTPSIPATVLRGVARELGRHPDWRVETDGLAAGDRPLLDALLDTPHLGLPGSNFIYPMVAQGADAAAELLVDVSSDPVEAQRAISRVAAWSMLQDDPDQAPYGWTHCLTIPQAVMSIGLPPAMAVAIAGTQMIGFRAAMGTKKLDPSQKMPKARAEDLATRASLHHDAHFVKYTLACFDAAAADPDYKGLYLAAAAYLADWWSQQPEAQEDGEGT
jgi:hypothetical protein